MATTATLDYRIPRDDRAVRRLCDLVRHHEWLFRLRMAAMLAVGIPLSFVPAAILASGISVGTAGSARWILWFQVLSLITIPIIYLIEWRTRGELLTDTLQSTGSPGGWSSRGEFEMQSAIAGLMLRLELCLLPARLTLSAVARLIERHKIGAANYPRCAEIMALLAESDEGVGVGRVMRPDEPAEELRRTLNLLRFHEWIDVSKDGKHLWICSPARPLIVGR